VLSTRPAKLDPDYTVPFPYDPAKEHYAYLSGTSMATGIAAGAAALVRQALRKINGKRKWSAALIKAILIHSAQYSPSYPDYQFRNPESRPPADHEEGWGHLNLEQVLLPNTRFGIALDTPFSSCSALRAIPQDWTLVNQPRRARQSETATTQKSERQRPTGTGGSGRFAGQTERMKL
jgi:hypothetical protein